MNHGWRSRPRTVVRARGDGEAQRDARSTSIAAPRPRRVAAERAARASPAGGARTSARGARREPVAARSALSRRCTARPRRAPAALGARPVRSSPDPGCRSPRARSCWPSRRVPLFWGSSVEAYAAQLAAITSSVSSSRPSRRSDPTPGPRAGRRSGWPVKSGRAVGRGAELIGIRRCISSEGRTAHVIYKWRGQPCRSTCSTAIARPTRRSDPRLVERLGQDER